MNEQSGVPQGELVVKAGTFSAYGNGWRQMWHFFLELVLLGVVSFLISIPTLGLWVDELEPIWSQYVSLSIFFIEIEGAPAYLLLALTYLILFEWPLECGIAYVFLKAARGESFTVKNMFHVFHNYSNAVLSSLLTAAITVIGIVFFIVPGIVFACKFAFVPYLIVDKKMEAVEAVKSSWRMTRGHAHTIFLIGFLSVFVALLGILFFGVGVFISVIWIRLASATIYFSVAGKTEQSNI